ncbi:MAG TPA: hypothetical protein VK445_08630 [Dissulfurispiraceae bacterium]|nr:hypothetical protein [Dissulfurispiraceae bacterium]
MKITEWLDEQEAAGVDVSQVSLPDDLAFEEDPDETIFFEEVNPCGLFCEQNHPFSTVERYGHWYYCRGQDKKAGIHATGMEWHFFTKDKELALRTARSHI